MISDAKLSELVAAYPVRELIDPKTGEGSGRFLVFCRLHFPAFDKPKSFEKDGAAKYQGCFLIDPRTDITKLQNAAKVAAVAKFGAPRAKQLAEAGSLKMPFRNQSLKKAAGEDGFGDAGVFFNASEGTTWPDGQPKEPPAIMSALAKRLPQDTKEVYAGCYGLVKVSFYGYSTKGNNGVAAALGGFQKLADGERLRTTKNNSEDGFAPVAGADEFAASASAPKADAMADW